MLDSFHRRNYTEAYKWFNLAASRPIALKNPGPYDLATYEKGKKTYRETLLSG